MNLYLNCSYFIEILKHHNIMRSIIDQAKHFINNFTFRSDDLPLSPSMQTLESLH